MAHTCGDHIRNRFERGATGRKRQRPGALLLFTRSRQRAESRNSNPFRNFYTNGFNGLCNRHGHCLADRGSGNARGILGGAHSHHIRHRTERGATGCDVPGCRHFHLFSGFCHSAQSRRTDFVRHFHPNRLDGLHDCHGIGFPHGESGNSGDYLGNSSGHHLWNGAEHNSTRRRFASRRRIRLRSGRRHSPQGRDANVVGDLHSHRRSRLQIHHRHGFVDRQSSEANDLLVLTSRRHLRDRSERDAARRDSERCRFVRILASVGCGERRRDPDSVRHLHTNGRHRLLNSRGQCDDHRLKGGAYRYPDQSQQHLRSGASHADRHLQRLRQRRYGSNGRDRLSEPDHNRYLGFRRRRLSNHRGAGYVVGRQLQLPVSRRHAHRQAGSTHGHRDELQQSLRRGHAYAHRYHQRLCQRRHGCYGRDGRSDSDHRGHGRL